jgi:hypothetical protein
MAGRNSAESNAKLLILNHISPKCEDDLPGTVEEAHQGANKKSSVLASFDFMEIVVPWMGFGTYSGEVHTLKTDEAGEQVEELKARVIRQLLG